MWKTSWPTMARRLAWALGWGFPLLAFGQSVVVGSKNFTESRLLAEMSSQLIERYTNLTVERKFGLAGTQVCFEALKGGDIDLYPEYTGTGLASILGHPPHLGAHQALMTVRREFLSRWDLWWVGPLGFENTYALATGQKWAQKWKLETISDLAKVSQGLRAGLGHEFIQREDGLPGLAQKYNLKFQSVRSMQQALKYQAIKEGHVDVIDVYSTDGRLMAYDLVVLKDDQGFFPPYEGAILARGGALEEFPKLGPLLGLLANSLSNSTMSQLNYRLQEKGESLQVVAQDALSNMGLFQELGRERPSSQDFKGRAPWKEVPHRAMEHLRLCGLALALGLLVAIPLGVVLFRNPSLAESVIRGVGLFQTIPSMALLAFMVPVLGVGTPPAIVALWVYSLYPILRNTYSGLKNVPRTIVDAGLGVGMSSWQILFWARLPLAAPTIMAGIRTSSVITVGTATLAAFIGGGGLGVPIVSGLQLADTSLILSGALPAAALAFLVDGGLGLVETWIRPRGVN